MPCGACEFDSRLGYFTIAGRQAPVGFHTPARPDRYRNLQLRSPLAAALLPIPRARCSPWRDRHDPVVQRQRRLRDMQKGAGSIPAGITAAACDTSMPEMARRETNKGPACRWGRLILARSVRSVRLRSGPLDGRLRGRPLEVATGAVSFPGFHWRPGTGVAQASTLGRQPDMVRRAALLMRATACW